MQRLAALLLYGRPFVVYKQMDGIWVRVNYEARGDLKMVVQPKLLHGWTIPTIKSANYRFWVFTMVHEELRRERHVVWMIPAQQEEQGERKIGCSLCEEEATVMYKVCEQLVYCSLEEHRDHWENEHRGNCS